VTDPLDEVQQGADDSDRPDEPVDEPEPVEEDA
jgi:hypothetical protein